MSLVCSNKKTGCDWKGSQSDLGSHEKECQYAVVSCSNECSKKTKLLRKDIEKHLLECPKRYYYCEVCGKREMFEKKSAHNKSCGSKREKCSQCNKFIVKGTRQEHMDKLCPSKKIKCPCEGCGMELLVKDLNRHIREAKHIDKTKMRELTHQDVEDGVSASSAAAGAANALPSGESRIRSSYCNIL